MRDWQLETDTLVILMTDNGHSIREGFNAGMRGMKGGPYQGGTRVPSFWCWPGRLPPGDRTQLAAHLDIFPTLAALAGASLSEDVLRQLEGRSLLPVLEDPAAPWPDRFLVTHVGRWDRGQARQSKHRQCSIRNGRFRLVNDTELYDLQADPGETTNIIAENPVVAETLRGAYDRWWEEILPCLENELVVGPALNPFKVAFWAQFGGEPDEVSLRMMHPSRFN